MPARRVPHAPDRSPLRCMAQVDPWLKNGEYRATAGLSRFYPATRADVYRADRWLLPEPSGMGEQHR
ncbi:unnamed protein product [Mycetohabitans rhizoxinica HKI 454]|uniref:Uncharacterized protein n=1 Tax=Mycetohabitans rhizoxinica (strain DSM 19002 / CIP 109453 / HKI 454) TaxID=882378 RepID=E5ALA8_MYCRK|nr:unnamed protein product [Mycetohabitans rhizoxinica HKI 454]